MNCEHRAWAPMGPTDRCGTLGKIRPPAPRKTCQSCIADLKQADDGPGRDAFLFSHLDSGQLAVLCDQCAAAFELNRESTPWRLVTL